MKRIEGFTIAELVVSMLLTAILVISVYSAYRYTSKTYEIFSKDSDDISDVYRLLGQMEDVFWCNDSVHVCNGRIEIFQNDSVKGIVETNGESLYFERGNEFRDTLQGEYVEISRLENKGESGCGKAEYCLIKIVIKGDSLVWGL